MQHPSYGWPSSFSSDPGSWGYRKRFLDWDKNLHCGRELPVWSTASPKDLVVRRKRPWQDCQPDKRSKRVASDRLTFVSGTFRPIVIVDDEESLDPVVPRTIDRSGRSWDCPLVVEDDLDDSAIRKSRATNPPNELRHAPKDLGWVDVTTDWIAPELSGLNRSPSNVEESALRTDYSLPKANLQKTSEYSQSDARHIGFSPTWKHSTWSTRRYNPYVPREHRSTSFPTSLKEAQDSISQSPLPETEGESGAWSDSTVTTPVRRSVVKDRLPIRERKAFFIRTPTSALGSAMSKFVGEVYAALPSLREEGACWLHPSPPRGRAKGCLSRIFCWTDESGKHKLDINFGIVALIVDSYLTEKQKEGWIMDSWHLSHLCGNWTCCNWRHFTVEPGRVNISRNVCFMHRSGCVHEPKCMKEKKQQLSQILRNSELITKSCHVSEATEGGEEHGCMDRQWGYV